MSEGGKYLAIYQRAHIKVFDIANKKEIFANYTKPIKTIVFDKSTKYIGILDDNNVFNAFNFFSEDQETPVFNKVFGKHEDILSISFTEDSNNISVLKGIIYDDFGNIESEGFLFSGVSFSALFREFVGQETKWEVVAELYPLNLLDQKEKEITKVWKISNDNNHIKSIIKKIDQQSYLPNKITFSENGKFIATHSSGLRASFSLGYEHSVISIWNIEKEEEIARVLMSPSYLADLFFNSDPTYIKINNSFWELNSLENILDISSDFNITNQLSSIAITENNFFIVSFFDEREKKTKVVELSPQLNEVFSIESDYGEDRPIISSNGKYIAIDDDEHLIFEILKISSDSILPIQKININKSEYVPTGIFSPDGQYFAITTFPEGGTGVFTLKTNIWEVETNNQVGQTIERTLPRPGISALSPKGKLLATVIGIGATSKVEIINTATGEKVDLPIEISHDDVVSDMKFSPDGNYLATVSQDKTARVWELATGNEIIRIVKKTPIDHIFFSTNSKDLFILAEGIVSRQSWQTIDLITQSCQRLTRNLTWQEWSEFLVNSPYEKTCHNLPIHRSVIEAAIRRAVFDKDIDGAVEIFNRILEIEPNADLNPSTTELEQDPKALAEKLINQDEYQSW